MGSIMEDARRMYFDLKATQEQVEAKMRAHGMPVPPRSQSFLELQRMFEPTLSDEILVENNDVPKNKGYLIQRGIR